MKSIIKILIALMAFLFVMAGCEYDVAEPQWTKEHQDPPVPVISEVDPPGGAVAGVNTVTIMGENFPIPWKRIMCILIIWRRRFWNHHPG